MKGIDYKGFHIRESKGHGKNFRTGTIQVMEVVGDGFRLITGFRFETMKSLSKQDAITKAKQWIDEHQNNT